MSDAPAPSVARVLIRRNFWPFFVGNLLSNSGTWFHNIAAVLLVYRLTGSPFLVGVVNFSQFAAILVLAPIAGSAADRFDRRRLLVATQVCATTLAGLLAVLSYADTAGAAVVIAISLGLGVTTALATPALQAIVPALVTRRELPAAVALNAVTFNLSRALGPVAGVFVIAHWDIPTAFAVNAFSYLALIGALAFVRPRPEPRAEGARPRLGETVRIVRGDIALLAPVVIVGLVSLSADPVNTLTPAFATEIYGRADTFTGVLVGAFGAGAVIAAFVVGGRFRPSRALLIVTLLIMGAGMAAFALSDPVAVGVLGLFLGGFGYLASVNAATSALQLAVKDSHRGRVMALWSLSFHGLRPLGSITDGSLASLAGVRVAGLVMTVPVIAAALGLALLRRFRDPERASSPARRGGARA